MYRPYSSFGNSKPARCSERAIKNELTVLVSRITRRRNPFCVLCGESNWNLLEAGHYFHRAMPPTEFDLDNLNTLCHRDNMAHERDPAPYRAYMLATLGQERYDELSRKAHAQTKINYTELLELREQMRSLYRELVAA